MKSKHIFESYHKLKTKNDNTLESDQVNVKGQYVENREDLGSRIIISRFASWKHKADQVIKKSEAFRTARETFVSKSMDVTKVVQKNIVNINKVMLRNINNCAEKLQKENVDYVNYVEKFNSEHINHLDEKTISKNGSSRYKMPDVNRNYSSTLNCTQSELNPSSSSEICSEYFDDNDNAPFNSNDSSVTTSSFCIDNLPATSVAFDHTTTFDNDVSDMRDTLLPEENLSIHRGRYRQNTSMNNSIDRVGDVKNMIRQIQTRVVEKSSIGIGNESQTSKIVQPMDIHEKSITSTLIHGQYEMLLGHGMLGVNLKQTFMKGGGVYIDYIIPGGNASRSGVIYVGDSLLKVGNIDVTNGTISNVPTIIAEQKRPVVLVLNSGYFVPWEKVDFIMIASGMINQILEEGRFDTIYLPFVKILNDGGYDCGIDNSNGHNSDVVLREENNMILNCNDVKLQSSLLNEFEHTNNQSLILTEDGKDIKLIGKKIKKCNIEDVTFTDNIDFSNETGEKDDNVDKKKGILSPLKRSLISKHKAFSEHIFPLFINYSVSKIPLNNIPWKYFKHYAFRRNNQKASLSALSRIYNGNPQFRYVLNEAFLTCCVDSRRLPFLVEFFSNKEKLENKMKTKFSSRKNIPLKSISLMFYLELISYRDIFELTPIKRRYDLAMCILYKYLVPRATQLDGSMFDMRSLLTSSTIDELERTLNVAEVNPKALTGDLFGDIEFTLENFLSGAVFTSFLTSDICARMRAYMRGTCPYIEINLKVLFSEVFKVNSDSPLHSIAINQFSYIMLFLISQKADISDKNFETTRNNTDVISSKRLMGSAGGIICAVFIKRVVISYINNTTKILKKIENYVTDTDSDHLAIFQKLIYSFEHLWEAFLSPSGGMLDSMSYSNEVQHVIDIARREIFRAVSPPKNLSYLQQGYYIICHLSKPDLVQYLKNLSDELIYDYVHYIHPKFRAHMCYEWMCEEMNKILQQYHHNENLKCNKHKVNNLVPFHFSGCIQRMMRRLEFPKGVSRHSPLCHSYDSSEKSLQRLDKNENKGGVNADYAIIFGTESIRHICSRTLKPSETSEEYSINRFACVSLHRSDDDTALGESDIPSSLESYAVVPPFRKRLLCKNMCKSLISDDGWEVSLVNFIIPNAKKDNGSDSSLYGVSLVIHYDHEKGKKYFNNIRKEAQKDLERIEKTSDNCIKEIAAAECLTSISRGICQRKKDDCSNLSFCESEIVNNIKPPLILLIKKNIRYNNCLAENVKVSSHPSELSPYLHKQNSFDRAFLQEKLNNSKSGLTIGIALVSGKNVILAMRKTLSCFYNGSSYTTDFHKKNRQRNCVTVVVTLGKIFNTNVDPCALRSVLDRYLKYGSSTWIERPVHCQRDVFEKEAGHALLKCLSPISLSLLFVTTLLEQKIVLCSCRRSILLSISIALRRLLSPLKWSHLCIPLVPSECADDLVQYPAPYILGIPSEDKNTTDLLNSLPEDVTVVDLDDGCVTLARKLSHNFKFTHSKEDLEMTETALKSQVLYLAEALGGILSVHQSDQMWLCDVPTNNFYRKSRLEAYWKGSEMKKNYEVVERIYREFLKELLYGVKTCCFWIKEEPHNSFHLKKSNVYYHDILFDEDRFFHIKDLRSRGLYIPLFKDQHFSFSECSSIEINAITRKNMFALSLDDFDLVLELFLRSQGLSSLITSFEKDKMIFW